MTIWSGGSKTNAEVEPPPVGQYDRMERGKEVLSTESAKGSSLPPSDQQRQRDPDPLVVQAIPSRGKKRSWKRCCCITCMSIFSIIVALGIVALVLYLVYKPQTPKIGVSDVSLHFIGLSPDPLNLTAPQLETMFAELATGSLTFHLLSNLSYMLQVHNPNKVQLDVGDSSVAIYYQTVMLSSGTIPSFSVSAHGTEVMPVTLPSDVPLPPSMALTAVNAILAGSIEMQTYVRTHADIKIWGITSPRVKASTTCHTKLQTLTLDIESNNCTTSYSGL